jgi:hypothetical protein
MSFTIQGSIPSRGRDLLLLLKCPQPPIHWVPGTLSLEVKWVGHEFEHTLCCSAEVKNAWSNIFIPLYAIMAYAWINVP